MFRSTLQLLLYSTITGALFFTPLYLPLPILCAGVLLFATLQLCASALKFRAKRSAP